MRRASSIILLNFLTSSKSVHFSSVTRSVTAFQTNLLAVRFQSSKLMGKANKKASGDDLSVSSSVLTIPSWFNAARMRVLREVPPSDSDKNKKCIVYWMQRDMRVDDNWALCYARHLSKEHNLPLRVVYSFNKIQCQTRRHASFLIGGLRSVENQLKSLNIPMDLRNSEGIKNYCKDKSPFVVVTDFHPLREFVQTTNVIVNDDAAPTVVQIDAHNVVPCWFVSDKKEVGARTIRNKINTNLPDFMVEYPSIQAQDKDQGADHNDIDWEAELNQFIGKDIDDDVSPVDWAQPGTAAGMKKFNSWVNSDSFKLFADKRNDPTLPNVISNLSPWINYGHVSFQRLALNVRSLKKYPNSTASYLEEGIVRRELSDNFVLYNPDYDSLNGAAGWAKESLELHASDEREYVYSKQDFIEAKTHDDLWNASQLQLVQEGKMHGFLRMYWAKKILEWTSSPEEALYIAQYLNDHYALDGNDPNGFVGVGWSIMGVHDMGWKERDIFGKIRFMNYAGCKRKFKVSEFVARYKGAAINASKALSHASAAKKRTSNSHVPAKKKSKQN